MLVVGSLEEPTVLDGRLHQLCNIVESESLGVAVDSIGVRIDSPGDCCVLGFRRW